MSQPTTAPASAPPASPPPLEGGKLVLATIAVALATFMNVLDTSIANVAIPTISGNLGVSVDEGTWVITVFAAANAVSIPLTGWLTQRIGQVKLFVGAILMFVLASWLCGIAPTLPILLVARIFQGAVAGPLIPLSQAILLGSYPKEKASTALALWAMTATVGPIAGPALGGWITDSYSWSWIFYINIPVGLFAAGVTWMIYRTRESPTRKPPIDVVGLGLLIAWVASLQIMLDKGKDLDWFSSPVIVVLGIIALISFAFFLVWELTEENPIVDLRLFQQRNFLGGTIAISVAYGVFFGNLVLLPQWMQEYLNYRSVDAGLVTAPLGIFAVMLAPVMGRVLPRSRRARHRDAGVCRLRDRVLHALEVRDRNRHVASGAADAAARHSDGAVLRAADVDHPVRPAAEQDSGGGGPVEFRARVLRRGGHVDRGQRMEQPHGAASRETHRAGHRQ